jgi:DMSO/TMAO reductase YedYZ molybdopterin-dependent catalytic subunit
MPKTTVSASLYCYGFLMASGNWSGVRLSYLLQQAGADYANASAIDFVASDGYQMSVPIEAALREDVIVAYEMDGKPLSEGFRLVIPEANGNTWIAEIATISMTDEADVVPQVSSWLIPTMALTAVGVAILWKKRLFRTR